LIARRADDAPISLQLSGFSRALFPLCGTDEALSTILLDHQSLRTTSNLLYESSGFKQSLIWLHSSSSDI
jgi:hypothetical protein